MNDKKYTRAIFLYHWIAINDIQKYECTCMKSYTRAAAYYASWVLSVKEENCLLNNMKVMGAYCSVIIYYEAFKNRNEKFHAISDFQLVKKIGVNAWKWRFPDCSILNLEDKDIHNQLVCQVSPSCSSLRDQNSLINVTP